MSRKLFFLLFLLSFLSPSLADNTTSASAICKSTPHPLYCRSVLPTLPGDVHYYGRFSLRKSLSRARRFLNLIEKRLRSRRSRAELPDAAVRALEDCRMLAGLTMDFLLNGFRTVNVTSKTLSYLKAEDVQTLLSAAITNEETCLEGLKATAEDGFSGDLFNDTKLYSTSLALFTKGWVPRRKRTSGFSWKPPKNFKQFPGFRKGRLPLNMSEKARAIYNSLTQRKLLQNDEANAVLVSDMVTVSQDGTGNFSTINDAVSAAPNDANADDGYFMIYVREGVYEEYVSIDKHKRHVMMIGDGINRTVITGNHSVVDGWTTFNSATFVVVAPNFMAVNMTFRNTAGPAKGQAVAVRSGGDLSLFYSCSFEAYQDTLYTHSLRQFYRECDVYGTVDFIFGNAAVVFQNCNIYPRQPRKGQSNMITAQGRSDPNQNTGTSIHGCKIKPADDLKWSNYTVQTYLGRPWKEYSRTVVMQTDIDGFVNPAGWQKWSGDFALPTLYYAEFNNTGPGSNTTNRVTWPGYHVINATDAANFTVSSFLLADDWIPQTGVFYVGGLIS